MCMNKKESIFSELKIHDYKKAFENAIKKGLKNPEDWMYMYSTCFKDYFKNCYTRNYVSYFNISNIFIEHHQRQKDK
jgi:hypothetical protein